MRGALTFKLPEEQEDFLIAQNGIKYKIALQDLDNWLRSKLKYAEMSDQEHEIYNSCRSKLHEFLNNQDVSIF